MTTQGHLDPQFVMELPVTKALFSGEQMPPEDQ